jgi:hypothetical protein
MFMKINDLTTNYSALCAPPALTVAAITRNIADFVPTLPGKADIVD